jgi:alcohol dehydrogenase, propanol-preferring
MKAMALVTAGSGRVQPHEMSRPVPGPSQVLVRVLACGVCRTDLHIVDGDLPDVVVPIVPGHEIVGRVEQVGGQVTTHAVGDRVGIPWLGSACGTCEFCRSSRENLCSKARFTGHHLHGGYAEFAVAEAAFCFHLPPTYDDEHAAPLLCAGLIGYRAYRTAGAGKHIGVYGFGAAAHIIAQVAHHQGRELYAFVSPGDYAALRFAEDVGVTWAGFSTEPPPRPLDSAIIFAPVGSLVPEALRHVRPGGKVICAGIHMSDIPSFPYRLLWGERTVASIANLTRQDAREFLAVAAVQPIVTHTRGYRLADANQAITDLRDGRIAGAAVLIP